MAFLDKTGLQNLTNKLVQGDAIKVASSKGTTVKEVIDNIQRECESVALPNTMILENRVNEFKIGQGRNIDVSRDVEEGISVIQLQGKTYQNLLLSSLYFSSHGSDITTINTSEYSIGIKPSGSTQLLKISAKLNCSLIKPNTTYTIILNKIYDSNDFFCVYDATTESFLRNYVHSNIFKFTTKNDLSHIRIYLQNSVINETKFFNKFIILEGDYTQTPTEELPQYFEGIKSSFEDKVVNINVQGKNLFDKSKTENILYNYFINNDGNIQGAKDTLTIRQKVKPNTKYSLNGNYNRNTVRFEDKNKEYISHTSNKIVTTPSNCEYIVWYVGNEAIKDKTVDNLQIEEAAVGTSFEPYYNYNYKFDIKEPLRRLPNGVCDEIRNNNGKWELVRRCHEVKMSSEILKNKILIWGESRDGFVQFYRYLKDTEIKHLPVMYCDGKTINNIVARNDGAYIKQYESFGFGGNNFDNSRYLSFSIATTRIKGLVTPITDNRNVQTVLNFLDQNDVKIIYELETPIVIPIDPIEFNVSQGTTISINSDIAPISTHEVILNRSGQIKQSIELIADLRSRIDNLEKAYDSNLIAAQYRLNNLKLNYELERKED